MTTDPTFIVPLPLPITRTLEQITQDIKASYDSVDLINEIVADDQHSDEIKDTVDRNVRHLRNCLTLPHIIENATNADKIAFADSVALGEAWLALLIT